MNLHELTGENGIVIMVYFFIIYSFWDSVIPVAANRRCLVVQEGSSSDEEGSSSSCSRASDESNGNKLLPVPPLMYHDKLANLSTAQVLYSTNWHTCPLHRYCEALIGIHVSCTGIVQH